MQHQVKVWGMILKKHQKLSKEHQVNDRGNDINDAFDAVERVLRRIQLQNFWGI